MRILAIGNQKGGVGKTTTTINLGAALVEAGKRVLLVDLDPQSSLTTALGLEPDSLETTIYEVLCAALEEGSHPLMSDATIQTKSGLHLVPANLTLSAAELDLMNAMGGEFALRDVFSQIDPSQYDIVLVDCLPSLGLLTINALAVANEILIPMQAQYLPMKALQLLLGTIAKARRKLNPDLSISGILLTMVDSQTIHHREVIENLRRVFSENDQVTVFQTEIKKAVALQEATVAGESILTYAPNHPVSNAYRNLAKEIV